MIFFRVPVLVVSSWLCFGFGIEIHVPGTRNRCRHRYNGGYCMVITRRPGIC